VARQASEALDADDVRWALELASWLVRSEVDGDGRCDGGSGEDRALLASVLRTIGQRTTSANVRGWCLTRALELEGAADVARHRGHRFGRRQVLAGSPATFVHTLRVLLDPDRAVGVDAHVRWRFADGLTTGLWVRNQVAVPTDGSGADLEVAMSHEALADLLSDRVAFSEAVASDAIVVTGEMDVVRHTLACFDLESLRR
jgi:alkyl sulfatase BDS1-like metallo-beta-lactamase superfamily hydrolase